MVSWHGMTHFVMRFVGRYNFGTGFDCAWYRKHFTKISRLWPSLVNTKQDVFSEKCSLWTKRCAAFGHTVWGCYYINFGGKLIYTARLWARILRASEAIWAAILAQMPQNFSHSMYLHMSSNRYVSRFYEQSSRWPKLMTINSTAQPIETHGKLAGVFP